MSMIHSTVPPWLLRTEADQRGLRPDAETYAVTIEALVRHEQAEEAVNVIRSMTDDGHQPDEPLYMSVIELCQQKGVEITVERKINTLG